MRIVVDASFLAYRAFFTEVKNLSYQNAQVGVIYGFLKQVFALADKFHSGDFVFCFDSRHSYRELFFPEYKCSRKNNRREETEEEKAQRQSMHDQVLLLRETVLPDMGFRNIYIQNGYEADDLIAYVVQRFPEDYMIVSNDEDLFQLLEDKNGCRIRIYNFKDIKDKQWFMDANLGLTPFYWAQVKALAGCNSDDVPGIGGIGVKTAVRYLTGKLPPDSNSFRLIKEGKAVFDRNMILVAIPYAGMKVIGIESIVENELTRKALQLTLRQYGFKTFLDDKNMQKILKDLGVE